MSLNLNLSLYLSLSRTNAHTHRVTHGMYSHCLQSIRTSAKTGSHLLMALRRLAQWETPSLNWLPYHHTALPPFPVPSSWCFRVLWERASVSWALFPLSLTLCVPLHPQDLFVSSFLKYAQLVYCPFSQVSGGWVSGHWGFYLLGALFHIL